MDKKIIFILIILIPFVSSNCGDNQININTASLEQLDELWGIGPSKAQSIIDSRPFESIDDLILVKGIWEVTLRKIISQGLACIESEESEEEDRKETEENYGKTNSEENKTEILKNITLAPIILNNINSKDIKMDNSTEEQNKNYSIYALIGFGILILILIKIRKKNGLI